MQKKKKLSNSVMIFLAMILGSIVGLIVGEPATAIGFIGTIWMNMMKMFLVPVVICVLVISIASMDDPAMLGRMALKCLIVFTVTTMIAICISIPIALIMKPGQGFTFEDGAADIGTSTIPSVSDFLMSLFSSNIFESFSNADMLQVLVIAILIGVAIVLVKDKEQRASIIGWFDSMYNLCMSLIGIVMALGPVGVFCLMASTMGQYGAGFIATISRLVATYYVAGILHFFVIIVGLPMLSGYHPLRFLKDVMPTVITACSTCSSAATIPTNLRVTLDNLHVPKEIANFCIPLGAQINQNGAAILVSVVMIFCAQATGVEFTISQLIQMILLSTIVSAGAAAVPGGGIVRLMIVGSAFSFPMELIAIVGSFYRLFDMGATAISTVGDASTALFVYRMEEKRKEKQKRRAGAVL